MILLKRSPLMGCLMLLLMCFSEQSKAVVGAELSYQYLNQNEYQLVLLVYRLCSDPLPANSQTLDYNSLSCGSSGAITLGLDTSYEISGINSYLYAQSSCNGGPHLGMEIFVYRDTLTFPQTCTDWLVSWTGCCRSSSITNLSTVGSPIYVEAGINSTGAYNFYSFSRHNYYCAADSMRENSFPRHVITETGDSLLSSFSCPMQGANNCLSHVAGLSATQPFVTHNSGAIQLDHLSGEINFHTQPGQSQIASMGMTVYQMNDGDTVGHLKYEIPMVILDSLCNAPVEVIKITSLLGAYDSLNNLMHFCYGNTNIMQLILFAPDGDTIIIEASRTNINQAFGPSAALFLNANPPYRHDSAQLSIQIQPPYTTEVNYCTYPTTIGVMGNSVTSPLSNTTTIELGCTIYEIRARASQTTVCPYINHEVQLNSTVIQPPTVSGAGHYQWTQLFGPPVLFSNDTIPNPIVTVPAYASGSSIVLEVSHVADLDSITNYVCTSTSNVVTLTYDTSNTCNIPYPKSIEGRVVDDLNQNCLLDSLEQQHRRTVLIAFDNGLDTFYYATDSLGYYEAYLDTGTYVVHFINNTPIWTGCPLTQIVHVDTSYSTQDVNFVVEPIEVCGQLEVNLIPANPLAQCVGRDILVSYSNIGTVDVFNAFVEITMDAGMTLVSSTLPLISQTNDTYRFNIDTIEYGTFGNFTINYIPSCQQLVKFYSIQAHIYPDTLCNALGRHIALEHVCDSGFVRYEVTNYSTSAAINLPYWIIQNNTIVDTGSVYLNSGQTATISYSLNGFGIEYYQLILDPSASSYIASLPISCFTPPILRDPFFAPNYQLPFVSTYYEWVGLAYDPNIKIANPEGYDSLHHYIFPNHPIDYTVHFQNTGTDTAEVVVILDTLSAHLNIGSLDMQGSSHPYTWRMLPYTPSGVHVLEITFDQIMLPDSNINEAASHGFVQYHIEQLADLPNFTRLENSASIYFDANAPIKTNTAFHTICDSCFAMNITNNSVVVGSEKVKNPLPSIRLYPNPSDKTLVLESNELIERILVYNTLGQLVVQEINVRQKRIPISTAALENGTYFVSLVINGTIVNQAFQVLH
jgi:hypothetical protein